MGYRVRDHEYAYCVWLKWDTKTLLAEWPSPSDVAQGKVPRGAMFQELYGTDNAANGTDFNGFDVMNAAYNVSAQTDSQTMYQYAFDFFNVFQPPLPPLPPTPATPTPPPAPTPGSPRSVECATAGGVLGKGTACCPAKACDGACGGKGCANHPGGKTDCCAKEVEGNGKDCLTSKAPCNVAE